LTDETRPVRHRTRSVFSVRALALCLVCVLVFAGAVTAAIVGASVHASIRLFGRDTAIAARIEAGLTLAQVAGRKGVLLLGDSRVESMRPPALHGAAYTYVVNAGVSGTTVETWATLLPPRSSTRRYATAVFWAGINDLLFGRTAAAQVATRISQVARRLREYAQRVWVVEQIPVRLAQLDASQALNARLTEINARVRAQLRREPAITIVSLHDSLRDPDGQLSSSYSRDGLHLNAKGQAQLLRQLRLQAAKQ
jgi:lysophospholipase L1-like esterase